MEGEGGSPVLCCDHRVSQGSLHTANDKASVCGSEQETLFDLQFGPVEFEVS